MMKAEELMIGDLVKVSMNQGTEVEYGRVANLDESGGIDVGVMGEPSTYWNLDGGDEILPIPLTREILKKNGWKYEFDKKKYMVKYDLKKEGKDCWMMWSIDEKTLDLQRQDSDLRDIYNLCVQRVVIPCNYVHELQHSLKLCGIKKKIIL